MGCITSKIGEYKKGKESVYIRKTRIRCLTKVLVTCYRQCKQILLDYITQPAFTCSKLTIETVEQGVKYVQS